jgi:hypothetical protein
VNDDSPSPRTSPFARLVDLPQRTTDQVRTLVDGALDRMFDEPFDIRSDTDFERILLEPASTGRPGAAASALAGFVAMATPFAERTLRIVRTGSKAPIPAAKAAKYAAIAVPIGVQLSSTVRRGIRELQALASFVIWRLRDEGIEPERSFVRALTVSLYVNPDRRPNLSIPSRRVAASLTRVWIFRAIGTDSESHVFKRGQAWIAALDRLDLADLARRQDPPAQLLPA